jgi:CBS domain-containing protein
MRASACAIVTTASINGLRQQEPDRLLGHQGLRAGADIVVGIITERDLVTNAIVGSRFGLALAWAVPVGVLGI